MHCRDAERLWNERIDVRGAGADGLEAALEAHAASCGACEAVAVRYRVLRRAIAAWSPVPATPEFVARLRLVPDVLPIRRPSRVALLARLSAAAAVLVAVLIGWRATVGRRGGDGQGAGPAPEVAANTLADALADAASSTLELARETSAPAGRVGRAVFASASLPDAEAPSPEVNVIPTSRVLRSVGGRVGAGVRPLSGSARNAFGFLLRTAPGDDPEPPKPPPPRGA